ncbi:MAG: cytochrome c3 family protein [Planctomycetes bacterium]|nr:cytochrome c3 family protein [Planctomycetota bacterium]
MDVLTTRRRTAWWQPLLVLLAYVIVASCLAVRPTRRSEPSFPHRVHVVDQKLECAFCHARARADDQPGMPPPELCAPCHERFDPQKPPERRLSAFFDGGRYRRLADARLPGDVAFSHRRHVTEAGLVCTGCHTDILEQDDVPLLPLVTKDGCMDCHRQHGSGNECRVCHATIDRSWRPHSHDRDWTHAHGNVARGGSTDNQDRCSLCHTETGSCRTCHQLSPPRDHDQQFRRRTHGLSASLDRARCAVCHTTDSCAQCHQQTPPQNHRGGFGAPGHRHCNGCHLPLADNGCRVCHPQASSHAAAAPLPGDHSPAMNCRLCHGNGVRLPHPDGGHVCTACHR